MAVARSPLVLLTWVPKIGRVWHTCRAGRRTRAFPFERRELNDGGVELVYLWLWIHERRLQGGIEPLPSLLAVTGNESVLGEGCVRGSFEGR